MRETLEIEVVKLHQDAIIPTKAHDHDSGYDIYALEDMLILPQISGDAELEIDEALINPEDRPKRYVAAKIRTGIAFNLPLYFEFQLRPRSGVGTKSCGRAVLGTCDGNYRGEYMVQMDNLGHGSKHAMLIDGTFTEEEYDEKVYLLIRKGDRIAQLVLAEVIPSTLKEATTLTETDRNASGFGSTGIVG